MINKSNNNMAEPKKTLKNTKRPYVFAVGRRKEAVARVRLFANGGKVEIGGKEYEKGDIVVNNKPISEYFRFQSYTPKYMQLLNTADAYGKFIFSVRVSGGGLAGQLDAIILGMARVLNTFDKEKYRPVLKKKGYFTRDARIRERRKVGMGGKARRKKQSPKR